MQRQQRKNKFHALSFLVVGLALPLGALVLDSSAAQAQKNGPKTGTLADQNRQGWQHRQGGQHRQGEQGYGRGRGHSANTGNAARINKIIQGLTPYQGSQPRSKHYRRKIRKVQTWRKGRGHGRAIIVNYNHSVDLSVYFEFNSARILPSARPVLDDLGYALSSPKLRYARYLIAGHTDSRGARGYNQWLSDERAKAVRDYLGYNFNIAPQRLVSVGFGEETPVNKRRPAAAINRRVEVSLIENNNSWAPQQTIQIRKYKFTPAR